MAVCPVDCFYQNEDGVVLHSKDLCIGCGYCFYACPFGAPQFPQAGNFGSHGKMDKCTFCAGGPEENNSTAEFAGLKIRYLGFGARVLEKFGASTQILAGGDIYTALELGTIDATEFSMPAIDLDLGFYQIAKHYYLPGWHQPANMGELIVNLDRWNALAEHQKALIETLCGDSIVDSIASGEAAQFTALEAIEGHGVTIHRWSPEMLAEFERQWVIVAAETAAEDEDFARVWASLSAFRERYTIWRDYGAFN